MAVRHSFHNGRSWLVLAAPIWMLFARIFVALPSFEAGLAEAIALLTVTHALCAEDRVLSGTSIDWEPQGLEDSICCQVSRFSVICKTIVFVNSWRGQHALVILSSLIGMIVVGSHITSHCSSPETLSAVSTLWGRNQICPLWLRQCNSG